MQNSDVLGAPVIATEQAVAADASRVEARLAAALRQDPTAILKVAVHFASAPIPPGPPSTLAARQEQAALRNLETIAGAIDRARRACNESPVSTSVFWLTSAISIEATPVFIKTLLDQPSIMRAAMNEQLGSHA